MGVIPFDEQKWGWLWSTLNKQVLGVKIGTLKFIWLYPPNGLYLNIKETT